MDDFENLDGDVDDVGFDTVETSGSSTTMYQDLLQTAVNDYYDSAAAQGYGEPAMGRDYSRFDLRRGSLRLKSDPRLELTNRRTGAALSLSTLAGRRGGGRIIRDELGFTDWRRKLPTHAVDALQNAEAALGAAASNAEHIELHDLVQTAKRASDIVESTLTDAEIDQVLSTMQDPPLNLRELRGLDKAMQRVRGELTNNLAKLSELDESIAAEKQKLDEAGDEFSRKRAAERIRSLEDEREARVEAASSNRVALRSQINRMRETIRKILEEDTTLAERLRTLFREQGITIASVLTAIGMTIAALVAALTGGAGTPKGDPTPPRSGIKEWAQKQLKALGRLLTSLAGKAAAALPGILGSIVSWLLGVLGKTAGWLGQNLWLLMLAALGILYQWVIRK